MESSFLTSEGTGKALYLNEEMSLKIVELGESVLFNFTFSEDKMNHVSKPSKNGRNQAHVNS